MANLYQWDAGGAVRTDPVRHVWRTDQAHVMECLMSPYDMHAISFQNVNIMVKKRYCHEQCNSFFGVSVNTSKSCW
ncbi:hypothetical protein Y1Q_0012482 [Alligator mississippiensis]|uniref:Uncharacterized protein n=1 Tax=Alligator mississippiensis TaxID=8496 RepID=A0A151M7S7_ALLMI|nr:hypothetical protein Y1Q_0012482 [Alligator mississippiensis]